jgi:hypothetical protein
MIKVTDIRTELFIEKLKEELRPIILAEGGLGGHMSHVHENPELTFGDIKKIMHLASLGKLENVSEKLDGQNVFFTYEPSSGLRFARNTAHIKTNGMDGEDIEARWGAGLPSVAKAYGDAYKVLSAAVASLSIEDRTEIFGDSGNIWYSAEILATGNPNVINYDGDAVVLHESGTVYDENGRPTDIDTSGNFVKLISSLNHMQDALDEQSWKLLGPIMVLLEKMSSKFALNLGLTDLESYMNIHGMNNDNTTIDLLEEYVLDEYLSDIDTDDDTKQYLAELIAKFDKPRDASILRDMVAESLITAQESKKIKPMFAMDFGEKLYAQLTAPLKNIISDFATEVLREVQSVLVLNPDKEVQRLKDEVQNIITAIEQSDVIEDKEFLANKLSSLGGIDKITSSMEGIVFKYKGNVLKLTGSFSATNSLLGFFKYGR